VSPWHAPSSRAGASAFADVCSLIADTLPVNGIDAVAADTSGANASVGPLSDVLSWGISVGAVADTTVAQRAALVDLYSATNGDSWICCNTGWQDYATTSDPCEDAWDGVACAGSPGDFNRDMYACQRVRRH
jgi:hypothetical protein